MKGYGRCRKWWLKSDISVFLSVRVRGRVLLTSLLCSGFQPPVFSIHHDISVVPPK